MVQVISMKNTTQAGELTEKQKLVVQIAEQYRTKAGSIDWKRAWGEHPEWQEQLQYNPKDKKCQGAHDIAWDLRNKKLIAKGEPRKQKGNRVATAMSEAQEKPAKKLRELKPPVKAVLDFMLEHADAKGYVDLNAMDAAQPGWRDGFGMTNRLMLMTMDRMRRSGRLAAERKAKLKAGLIERLVDARAAKAAKANGVHTNGNGAPAPAAPDQPEAISEEQLERMVARRVEQRIAEVLEESGCCQKCGKSFKPQIAMELAAMKHSR